MVFCVHGSFLSKKKKCIVSNVNWCMYCPSSESSKTVAFFFFLNICYQIWGGGEGKEAEVLLNCA